MPEKMDVKSTVMPMTPGRDELQIVAVAGLFEDGAEAEAERQQIEHGWPSEATICARERSSASAPAAREYRSRSSVTSLPFHICAIWRIWSAASRRLRRGWWSR